MLILRAFFVTTLCLAAATGQVPAPPSPSPAPAQTAAPTPAQTAAPAAEDFSVLIIPDAQYYPAEIHGAHNSMYTAIMQWANNNAAQENLRAVVSLGDLVDNGNNNLQWQRAAEAFALLHKSQLPYVPTIGNHDYDSANGGIPPKRAATHYVYYFGDISREDWFGASLRDRTSNDVDTPNFWVKFDNAGQHYGVISLEFCPRVAAVNWAGDVLQQNRDRQFLVVTHDYLFTNGERHKVTDPINCNWYLQPPQGGDGDSTSGEDLWLRVLSKRANVIAVMGGHLTPQTTKVGGPAAHSVATGSAGNRVAQFFADYQDEEFGGAGFVQLLKFRPGLHRIDVTTFSPYCLANPKAVPCLEGVAKSDSSSQFSVPYGPE